MYETEKIRESVCGVSFRKRYEDIENGPALMGARSVATTGVTSAVMMAVRMIEYIEHHIISSAIVTVRVRESMREGKCVCRKGREQHCQKKSVRE